MLRVQLESLIAEADVWAIGERLPKKSSTPSSIVDEACRYVIENTFAKLKMLRRSTAISHVKSMRCLR
jgi:hypothetical protein